MDRYKLINILILLLLIPSLSYAGVVMMGGSVPAVATTSYFVTTTADGYIYGNNSTYSTARSTSVTQDQASQYGYLGQQKSGNYYPMRSFVAFDTSAIPDGATITSVTIGFMLYPAFTGGHDDLKVVQYDWSANADFSNATQRENAYDGCLAAGITESFLWKNSADVSDATQYFSVPLTTAYVNKTGTTYYCLISALDIANTAPSANSYGQPYLNHASNTCADPTASSCKIPVLKVVY